MHLRLYTLLSPVQPEALGQAFGRLHGARLFCQLAVCLRAKGAVSQSCPANGPGMQTGPRPWVCSQTSAWVASLGMYLLGSKPAHGRQWGRDAITHIDAVADNNHPAVMQLMAMCLFVFIGTGARDAACIRAYDNFMHCPACLWRVLDQFFCPLAPSLHA